MMALAAVLQNVIPVKSALVSVPYLLAATALMGVAFRAGYVQSLVSAGGLFTRRSHNTLLSLLSRYAADALGSAANRVEPDDVLLLVRKQAGLSVVEAWFEEGPVLIGSSGVLRKDNADGLLLDSIERLRVKSLYGKHIVIRFQFDHKPVDTELEDVSNCLARIFEHAKIRRITRRQPGPAPGMPVPDLDNIFGRG
jgi:hypothetical protein